MEKSSNASIYPHRTTEIFSVLSGFTSINRNLPFVVPATGARLESCVQFCAPQHKDIKLLESVQRRVAGIVAWRESCMRSS